MMDDEEVPRKSGRTAEVVSSIAVIVYYLYLMGQSTTDVVPLRNKIYHYGSKAAEKVAAFAWDTALKLRREYRKEVEK